MEQESEYKNTAVIGLGAAGGLVSVLLSKNPCLNITAFDVKEPFSSLLPTGGGRCNITYDEDDVREFVKNYPRGNKFLLSVFSRFGQKQTRKLFADLGVKTYVQADNRVFPVTDSAAKTILTLKKHLETSNFTFRKERVTQVTKNTRNFTVNTEKSMYNFDAVIIASGGKSNGFDIARSLGHKIIDVKPSLTALDIKEKNFYKLTGLSFKNAKAQIMGRKKKYPACIGDLLITHRSLSGPIIFKVSALSAYEDITSENPLKIVLKTTDFSNEDIEEEIKNNSKKSVKNIFSKFAPESFINEILSLNNIESNKQAAQLKKTEREIITKSLNGLELNVINRIKNSEIITAGGVDLNEVNSKTMESKLVNGLFFAGEILNIDGFTGGFNLQSAWSTAYIVSTNFN